MRHSGDWRRRLDKGVVSEWIIILGAIWVGLVWMLWAFGFIVLH